MANDATKVRVGVGGAIWVAPLGTAIPDSEVTGAAGIAATLDVAFSDLGYLNEDGLRESSDRSVNDIVAWQNADVVRKIQTSHEVSYALDFLETNAGVLETYYGNHSSGVTEIKGDILPNRSYVFDVVDGSANIRIVVPNGQVTEQGEVQYQNGEALIYPAVITCFPDASGVKAYRYDDAAA